MVRPHLVTFTTATFQSHLHSLVFIAFLDASFAFWSKHQKTLLHVSSCCWLKVNEHLCLLWSCRSVYIFFCVFRFYIESISYLKDNATIELFFLNAKSIIYKVNCYFFLCISSTAGFLSFSFGLSLHAVWMIWILCEIAFKAKIFFWP